MAKNDERGYQLRTQTRLRLADCRTFGEIKTISFAFNAPGDAVQGAAGAHVCFSVGGGVHSAAGASVAPGDAVQGAAGAKVAPGDAVQGAAGANVAPGDAVHTLAGAGVAPAKKQETTGVFHEWRKANFSFFVQPVVHSFMCIQTV